MIDEHRAIIGFNETIRNWHEERYFTSFSRGIGIQFSTSNNTTSLNDHWLVYRHCAKLRKWYKAEKYTSSYKQATSLSPNQSASYMHLFSSTRKTPKEIGINENSLKSKRSKPTWFCRPSTELQRNREQRFKGWCHLPWLSDVEIRGSVVGLNEMFRWKGLARTQIPTNKNDDVEFPTFGEIAGVNHSLVQWSSLALEEPPSWSWLRPLVQVSMLHPRVFKNSQMWFF